MLGPMAEIIAMVADRYNMTIADIVGKTKVWHKSHRRQEAMYLCRRNVGATYHEIARQFGCDHSTVIYAVKQVEKRDKERKTASMLILDMLREEPNLSPSIMSGRSGLPRSTVSDAAYNLFRDGEVDRIKVGPNYKYFLKGQE